MNRFGLIEELHYYLYLKKELRHIRQALDNLEKSQQVQLQTTTLKITQLEHTLRQFNQELAAMHYAKTFKLAFVVHPIEFTPKELTRCHYYQRVSYQKVANRLTGWFWFFILLTIGGGLAFFNYPLPSIFLALPLIFMSLALFVAFKKIRAKRLQQKILQACKNSNFYSGTSLATRIAHSYLQKKKLNSKRHYLKTQAAAKTAVFQSTYQALQQEQKDLKNKLVYLKYEPLLSDKFDTEKSVTDLITLLKNCRAETLEEAIKLYHYEQIDSSTIKERSQTEQLFQPEFA